MADEPKSTTIRITLSPSGNLQTVSELSAVVTIGLLELAKASLIRKELGPEIPLGVGAGGVIQRTKGLTIRRADRGS